MPSHCVQLWIKCRRLVPKSLTSCTCCRRGAWPHQNTFRKSCLRGPTHWSPPPPARKSGKASAAKQIANNPGFKVAQLPSEDQALITTSPSSWLLVLAPSEAEGGKAGVQVSLLAEVRAPFCWGTCWRDCGAAALPAHGRDVLCLAPSLHRVLGVQSMLVPAGSFGRAVPWLVAQPSTGEATWDTHLQRASSLPT